jgi:4,5:9,10-diseco-3-hydroxy-5,9,17-trioxoandrosta-1(10),2-diene-4-oate hydrolase
MVARMVAVGTLRLHVVEAGPPDAPALLCLHGLGASHAIWAPVLDAFADRHRVVALDLPGHGRSSKPDAAYDAAFYAEAVDGLARALGIERAVVFGSSLGGRVALELAIRRPHLARALVLAAPAGDYASALRPAAMLFDLLPGPRILRAGLRRGLERSFHDPQNPSCAARRRIQEEQIAADDFPQFARAITRSIAALLRSPRQPVEQVTQPVLVCWGREDRIVPVARARALVGRVPHARLHVFDRCGHLPMLECTAQYLEVVGAFLDELRAAQVRAAVGG